MKCIHCGRDAKYKERANGKCPGCSKRFAFEPKKGDRVTDAAFKAAIDAVSANGHIRWGVEHLFYELSRRLSRRRLSIKYFAVPFVLGSLLLIANGRQAFIALWLPACFGIWWLIRRNRPRTLLLARPDFDALWNKWVHAHGSPAGLIVRKTTPAPRRSKEADIGDYSFDRAVVCDRARTVDLLIANNFHFENNCAVLSIGGYPEGPFELVRTMLRRNPKLQVFALHDATVPGCQLAYKLATDDAWFKGRGSVTDVGLRPSHAPPFRGLLQAESGGGHVTAGNGIRSDEVPWLAAYSLELAAIRPEQVLKRLFKAINRREESDSPRGDGGGDSRLDTSTSVAVAHNQADDDGAYDSDDSSFSADAGDSDGGADSFG